MALTLVQGSSLGAWGATTNGATATDPVAVTWAQARAVGSLLVLVYSSDGLVTVPPGWASAVVALDYCDMEICYRTAANNATDAPSIDNNASTCLAWAEYSGWDGAAPDKTASSTGNTFTGTQSRTTGTTGTTVQADELAVAAWYYSCANGMTGAQWSGQTNSFTEAADVGTTKGAGTNVGLCVATRDLAATGAYSSSASITYPAGPGPNNGNGGAIATFKAAAVTAKAPPRARRPARRWFRTAGGLLAPLPGVLLAG